MNQLDKRYRFAVNCPFADRTDRFDKPEILRGFNSFIREVEPRQQDSTAVLLPSTGGAARKISG
jgi:hypothetical protein